MRVEFLFFRWLLVIAVVAIGLVYASSSHHVPRSGYESIALIKDGRSSGLPLAGIAIDPVRRDVYAIVGAANNKEAAGQFFVVWKGQGGETYATAFPHRAEGDETLFEVSPEGRIQTVRKFPPEGPVQQPVLDERMASGEIALRSIIDALPEASRAP